MFKIKKIFNGVKTTAAKNKLIISAVLVAIPVILFIAYRFFIMPVIYYNKKLYNFYNYNIGIGKSSKIHLLKLDNIKKIKPYFRTIKEIKVFPTIRASGRTTFASPLVRIISLKFGGYISKIYADKAGIKVHKGMPLFLLYSPSLIDAENDYILAYKNYLRLKNTSFKSQAETIYLSAEKKLLFWGINKYQLKKIEKDNKIIKQIPIYSPINGIVVKKLISDGGYVKPSARLYELADISKLWMKIFINVRDLKFIHIGKRVSLRFTYYGNTIFHGIISYIYPYTFKKGKFIKARISIDNKKDILKINSYGNVYIKMPYSKRLVVPISAVAHIDHKDIVLIYNKNKNVFQAKSIIVGTRYGSYYSVIEGLKSNETVVDLKNLNKVSVNKAEKIYHYLILSSVKIKSL